MSNKFLLATFEGGGSVTPMLGLARKLVQRGHHVRVMSDACNRPEAEAAGAVFVAWKRAPSKPARAREFDTWDDWSQENPADGFANLMENVLAGPALAFAEDVIEELQAEPADLVVSSEMLFGVPLACEALGQKLALMAMNIPLFPMTGFIPLGPGLAPPRTDAERAMHAEITAGIVAMIDASLPAFNAARAKLGLAPLAHMTEQHGAAEVMLLATSRAFDFAPDVLPPKVSYVGPQLDEPAWTQPWTSPFGAKDVRPLALVSFSTTFQDHAGVLQNVIDAISSLPMKAVVTTGGGIRPDEVRAAENVAVMESAPHNAILREAALAVTHGGHGTLMKILASGAPSLILPHGRDQEDNATRVAERGAGIKLPRTASVTEIRAALTRLLTEDTFTVCARALGAHVAADAANSPLVATLERLAQTPAAPADGRANLLSLAV